MSYLEKLSKRKRDMVNRCLEGKGFFFFFLGYRSTDRSIWQSCVSIHEVTFPLPWEPTVVAWEACSAVAAKWQIVPSIRGWGNSHRSWIPTKWELMIAAICQWLWSAWDRQQSLPFYFFCGCLSEFTDSTVQQLRQLNFLISLGHMAPGLMASIGTWHPVTPASWDLKMVLFPNK